MRKTANYILLFLAACWMISACEEADSTFKEFIVEGGLVYPGRASSPLAHSGKNKVLITWLKGTDPSVASAKVYWDNYTDSVSVSIPPSADTIRVLIDNLVEKPYSFQIVTYDEKGNASVPVELLSAAYGDKYQESLLSRPLNQVVSALNDTLTLEWGSADVANGAYETELQYLDTEGNTRVAHVSADRAMSFLTKLKPGTGIKYRTVYLPDSLSIDTFYTAYEESRQFTFDKEDWTIVDFSSEHPGTDNSAVNLIDGTDGTRWHTWAGNSSYPHHITIDLGGERTITRFGLWRTTFENGGDDRAPDRIQFLMSRDNVSWADLGEYDFNRFLNGEQSYAVPDGARARYFRLVAVAGPLEYCVLGEFSAYGY